MARVLLPLLLLVLALSPGGAPSPTLAQDCNKADIVDVDEGEERIKSSTSTDGEYSAVSLYIMPKKGFQGIRLDVFKDGDKQHSTWFNGTCFPQDQEEDKWWKLTAWADIDSSRLSVGFLIDTCWKECTINSDLQSLQKLSVVAYGPSRWINGEPKDCDYIFLGSSTAPSPIPTCDTTTITATPSEAPTTTATSRAPKSLSDSKLLLTKTVIIIASTIGAALLVVLVVVVVVVVVVVCWKRKPGTSPSTSEPAQPDIELQQVTQNDLYESYDNYANEDSRPAVRQATPHTTQNDLYEEFSQPMEDNLQDEIPHPEEVDLYDSL